MLDKRTGDLALLRPLPAALPSSDRRSDGRRGVEQRHHGRGSRHGCRASIEASCSLVHRHTVGSPAEIEIKILPEREKKKRKKKGKSRTLTVRSADDARVVGRASMPAKVGVQQELHALSTLPSRSSATAQRRSCPRRRTEMSVLYESDTERERSWGR